MSQILKYTLEITDIQELSIPGGVILSAEEQNTKIVVYALVNDEEPAIDYVFYIFGTGHTIANLHPRVKFLGTVKLWNGALMFHMFYKNKAHKGV